MEWIMIFGQPRILATFRAPGRAGPAAVTVVAAVAVLTRSDSEAASDSESDGPIRDANSKQKPRPLLATVP
jgi:hypothetical protein